MVEEKIEILNEIKRNEGPPLPEIVEQDIEFTTVVENLMKKKRGEAVEPIENPATKKNQLDRALFRENNTYRAERMYR